MTITLLRVRLKAHDALATTPLRPGTFRVPCPRLLAATLPLLVAALGPGIMTLYHRRYIIIYNIMYHRWDILFKCVANCAKFTAADPDDLECKRWLPFKF